MTSLIDTARLARLYLKGEGGGFDPDELQPKPNTLLLSPILPPDQSEGGIVMPGVVKGIPGMTALVYRVEAVGPIVEGDRAHGGVNPRTCIVPEVGELVHVRNAMLDPAQPDCLLLWCDVQHVLARVRPG